MTWQQILKDLKAQGLTQPQIAKHCGCSQASISDLHKGITKDPRHSIGVGLLELHRKKMKKARPEKTV